MGQVVLQVLEREGERERRDPIVRFPDDWSVDAAHISSSWAHIPASFRPGGAIGGQGNPVTSEMSDPRILSVT
jgi:hypothetical protein